MYRSWRGSHSIEPFWTSLGESRGRRRGRGIHFKLPSIGMVLLVAGACQEGPALPLRNGDLADPAAATARLLELDTCADPPLGDVLLNRLLEAVNQERAEAGLKPLRREDTLTVIADFYACRLAEGGFFSHRDPFDNSTVDSRAITFGYPFVKVGENLAAGQLSVDEVVEAWMESPGHKANILDPDFTEIGLAVKLGGADGPYWVQEFGRPSSLPLRPLRAQVQSAAALSSQPANESGESSSQPSE